ncbi:MAG: HAD-IC family P-type ATPase [Bacteroidetes bacterium]|nr:HAD-IC family P-type ATPase [Bacteroidota bacterium]MBT6686947.1 HAD-IC family P-type ATPase [Bacteroidota bacterium]MBT7143199.1 HAD-IC family P-type ATPase [Bacteroidota bacterium]MBT7492823.1 HAD-IC family P-type ATPase [Bacteroidota bacterium]
MSKSNSKTDHKCVHCGADCGKYPVVWNDLKFCCNGCLTVYQLLNENKLYKYYEIEKTPGIKPNENKYNRKYDFLDREEVHEKLFDFDEGEIAKVSLYIPAIHCASCIWLLENLKLLNPDIKISYVNFSKKQVSVTFDKSKISLRQLVELLASIHYEPEISLNAKDESSQKNSSKILLYKIGVAGFVFGNVMLYALPEYFNGKQLEGNLGSFLSILSYVMVFPVVFFSGNGYIISAYKSLKKKVINIDIPIALGILVLFLQTSYEIFSGTGTGYSDSLAGLIFFLLLGKWYQGKSYDALSFDRDYKSYFPIAVTKISEEKEEVLLLNEIKKGDEILIRNKELIPADSKISSGSGIIDYSFVSGESKPVLKKVGDFVYAGGRQTGSSITVKIEKEVVQSHLTKLWNQSENEDSKKISLSDLIDRISKYFTIVVMFIAILGSTFWLFQGDVKTAIFSFTAVLIVACPCALALSIPFTFGNTMRLFGNAGMYLKNTSVVENLTKIDTIVFDKTGTITKPDENNIKFIGGELSENEKSAIMSICKQSTHPLSNAIYKFYENCDYIEPEQYVEMAGKGIFCQFDNLKIRIGSEKFVANTEQNKANSSTTVYLSINEKMKGFWQINNKYRFGFQNVINTLTKKFELFLLSGDNDSEKSNLLKYFKKSHLHFNQKPQDKKDFIKKLQSQNKTILMTGDGLNDAGALMQSNVALTIADNVYHFSPAGDAILEASKFHKLFDFINFTKTAMKIVKMSFAISFFYNIIGISYAISGNLSPVVAAILMPVSSVSVVAFATFVTRYFGKRLK